MVHVLSLIVQRTIPTRIIDESTMNYRKQSPKTTRQRATACSLRAANARSDVILQRGFDTLVKGLKYPALQGAALIWTLIWLTLCHTASAREPLNKSWSAVLRVKYARSALP